MKKCLLVKKVFLVVNLLCFVLLNATAQQQAVLFEMKYLPGLKYLVKASTTTNMQLTFKDDSATKGNALIDSPPNSVILQSKSTSAYTVSTGNFNINKSSGVSIDHILISNKQFVNGAEIPRVDESLTGQQLTGLLLGSGNISIDSGAYFSYNDTLKRKLADLIKSAQTKIIFPANTLKVGDTFNQDIPMDIPIGGKSTPINTQVIYKLSAVRNNTAIFELTENINLNAQIPQGEIEVKGSGDGSVFFDISNKFLTIYETNVTLNYKFIIERKVLNGTIKIFSNYQVQIEKK